MRINSYKTRYFVSTIFPAHSFNIPYIISIYVINFKRKLGFLFTFVLLLYYDVYAYHLLCCTVELDMVFKKNSGHNCAIVA